MDEFRRNILLRWYTEAINFIPSHEMNPSDVDLNNYSLEKMVELSTGLIFCEMSFEAFLMGKYDKSGSNGFIRLDREYSGYYHQWKQESAFKSLLDRLVKETRQNHVLNMGTRRSEARYIDDSSSLSNLLYLIYRIRSNLVHGGKDIHYSRDRVLIHYGFAVLFILLGLVAKSNLTLCQCQ